MASWLLRIIVTLALAAAGVLTFAAAYERWWPACPRGGFESPACLRIQSHEFDQLLPSDPWQPVGQAAEYAGLSLLALAVAALVLPFVLRPGRPIGRWLVLMTVLAVVPAGALVLLGVTTLQAGLTGQPASAPGAALAVLVWAVAWPAALLAFAALAPGVTSRAGAVTVAFLVGCSTPVPTILFLGPIAAGYVSFDTAPWTEATAAPLLLLSAFAVWPATVAGRHRPARRAGGSATGRDGGPWVGARSVL